MAEGSEGTGRPTPRRRPKTGSRTVRPGQTAPPAPAPSDADTLYRGPTSWTDKLTARLVFWLKGWFVPSVRLAVSLVVIAYMGWRVLPPIVTHYRLHDDMVEIARRPNDDGETRRLIMESLERRGVIKGLDPAGVTLQTNPSGKNRSISFSYLAKLSMIPGQIHRFEVSIDIKEPVLFQPRTKHF